MSPTTPPTSSTTRRSLADLVDPTASVRVLRIEWAAGGDRGALRLRQASAPSFTVELSGLDLSYQVAGSSGAVCIGRPGFRPNEADYVDCDNQAQPSSLLCVRCSIAEAGFASSLHHAHTKSADAIDPDVSQYLHRPNALYLAAFRDGSLKVGTSTMTRRDRRWTEQGAWRARQVAEASDGIVVRKAEDMVTAALGLPQSVSMRRKISGLLNPMPDAKLETDLEEATKRVHDCLAGRFGTDLRLDSEPWSYPGSEDGIWAKLFRYPQSLGQGSHNITVDRLCGRAGVLGKPGSTDLFTADLGHLRGAELQLGDVEPNQVLVQDTLF